MEQEKSEILAHYKMRKSVYDRATQAGLSQERAVLLA